MRSQGDGCSAMARLPALLVMGVAPVILLLNLSGCLLINWLMPGAPDTLLMESRVYVLDGLNSPYDDFNAAPVPPPLEMDALVIFASNNASQGDQFSIEIGRLQIVQNPYSAHKDETPPEPEIIAGRAGPFPLIPPSEHNHLGPTPLVSLATEPQRYERYFSHYQNRTLQLDVDKEPLPWEEEGLLEGGGVWMFDSDQQGRRNLYFVDRAGQARSFFANVPDADDAYATYDFERHVLYFSSNRSGRFQIYRYQNLTQNTRFEAWLGDGSRANEVELVAEFQSGGNSVAPFVEGDLLVFASDRTGGLGGYDLYASRWRDGNWETPINMQKLMPEGVSLNTAGNEFRPSLLSLRLGNYHELRVLVFSSDRPGGQGGYDLYLTALPDSW